MRVVDTSEDEEADVGMPWHGGAPDGGGGAREEEGEEGGEPMERVDGDDSDVDLGVERVEVGVVASTWEGAIVEDGVGIEDELLIVVGSQGEATAEVDVPVQHEHHCR
ncbi:hypothetical protein GUJ93_ZPchr0008g13159 [Zizania palustris]|uniref:Uncharacterized protein n=1 Tax=Zizania palustris TaxID=103762 RepID=A0A8J5RKK1_ZIZPA|nr:hypothetical protein GUJ93_ZPchr0008g13159 [Zizania palustris]